jgi:hypothetical protein
VSLIFIDVGDMEFIWGDYEKSLGFEIYKANQLIFRSKESYRLQDFKSMAFDDGLILFLKLVIWKLLFMSFPIIHGFYKNNKNPLPRKNT